MTTFLSFLIAALAIIGLVQIIRIFEIASKINPSPDKITTDQDNRFNALALLIVGLGFTAFVIYSFKLWGHFILPDPVSLHGEGIKLLWDITGYLILVTFVITQTLLFVFAYKYRGKEGNTALFQTHNNKLELLWTSVPAVVLTALILFGLSTWNSTMVPDTTDAHIVEVYGQQFNWTARYAGDDNQLGDAHYTLIEGVNTLGVDIRDSASYDDKIVREIHLPVNKQVLMMFRAQDVIHSAYMPHFNVQMNCVPGMNTQFAFTPTMTTEEMRKDPDIIKKMDLINAERAKRGDFLVDFEYVLLCNKICGSAHYNMQIKVIVETEEEYNAWLSEQETFSSLVSVQ
jgi:cytochrome c oxidase subunit II